MDAQIKDIMDREENYKNLLMEKLKKDSRLQLSCPDFKYPEPLYLYVNSKKTGKSIAIRLDGEDSTMRFWDYVDDDYSDEDGVWNSMTEKGVEKFLKKLVCVMNRAIDTEFFDGSAECIDCFSCVPEKELDEEIARKAAKKFGKGMDFTLAKVSDFFGEKLFVFDKNYKLIQKK